LSLGHEFVCQADVFGYVRKSGSQAFQKSSASCQDDAVSALPGDQPVAGLQIQGLAKA
jgi:hypothetical protein